MTAYDATKADHLNKNIQGLKEFEDLVEEENINEGSDKFDKNIKDNDKWVLKENEFV